MPKQFDPYKFEDYLEIANFLQAQLQVQPQIAVILGSALDGLANRVTDAKVIDYKQIPGFLQTSNPAHKGQLISGQLAGKQVILLSGRFHPYEGHAYPSLAQPIRILHLLGVKTLIVSNAAGGVNPDFQVGDLMIIEDQINLSGRSPLAGPNLDQFGPRFPDLSELYTPALRQTALNAAHELGLDQIIRQGTYFFMPGPQYETPAEIRAIRILGGDAVGMSTVTETVVAGHCGMQVLGLSMITNLAAGLSPQKLSDQEVLATGKKVSRAFEDLVINCISKI